jgi:C-terminal processing protease CtpA/Prc
MKKVKHSLVSLMLILGLGAISFPQILINEKASKEDRVLNRDRGYQMLKSIKDVLEKHYYDKNYRGIDLDKSFKDAREKIKTLETNAQIFRVIAALLLEFDDSHTRFFPPGRANRVEYGFTMQTIGLSCFVVEVKKGSDAEAKGIKAGDEIVRIGQYPVTRDTLWGLNYFIYQLEPMPILPVTLRGQNKTERTIGVEASFKSIEERAKEAEKRRKEKQENPYKCSKLSADTTACKLRTFSVEKKFIDRMMKEASAGSKLILDLRGNRGGLVKIEEYLTGHFFDKEVKIADMKWRNKSEVRIAKPVKDRQFKGELIVLTDSDSASASEVFARVIQLEKRGKVVGDVTAGAVMTSYGISLANSRGYMVQTLSFYGVNVTVADLIMADGKRLEKVGVIPDYPVGPTSEALAMRNDPVLAYAANLFGAPMTPETAGQLGFLFKKAESDDEDEKEPDSTDTKDR